MSDPAPDRPAGAATDDPGVHAAQLSAFRALHAVTRRVHASLDLTVTLDAVAQGVVDVAGFGIAVVNLARDGEFEAVSVCGDDEARKALLGTRDTRERWERMLRYSEDLGGLRFIDHRTHIPQDDDVCAWVPPFEKETYRCDEWHPMDALFAPLRAPSGEWIGVLSVDMPLGGRRPDALQLEMLVVFADQAALAIEHARMFEALRATEAEARYVATHDFLTGLANRALLMSEGERRASADGQELTVVVVDLDGFKGVNDAYGHRQGDVVLEAVAQALLQCVRDDDLVARAGGDEFVVVMSGVGAGAAARSLRARLPDALQAIVDTTPAVNGIGASTGSASARTPVRFADLLSEADAAMYATKRLSRR